MAAVFLLAPAAPPLTYTPFAIEAEAEDRPAWSPDGKSIAYLKPVDQRPQVFVRALDSTAAAQLTKGAAFVTTVFWAPDGARIYFVSANTLFAISPAGGPAQKIAGDALSAAISPDGNHFVYLSWERRHAMTQPVNGGPAVPYYPKETQWTGVAARMQFATDGKRVFFNARQGATAEEAEFRLLEFPFPAAGGPRSLHLPPALTPGISDASLASISWLPDSRHFLTSGIFPGQFSSNLYLADSRSGKVRALTSGPGNATSPVVSRDGRRAAFIVGERSRDIVEFALPSTAGAEIPLRKILASATEESDPVWSPDGAALAYSATVAGSMNRIFVRSADGAWTRSLTLECDPGESLTEPRISPDGQRVAVEVRSQARHIIAVASISGGKLVPIDTVSRHQHNPRWSPDGNWLVYDAEVDNHLKTIFKAPIGGLGKPVPLARSPHNAQAQYVWLPDGNSILAIAPRDMYRIPANGGEPERIGDGSRTHTFDPRTQTIWLVKDGTAGRVELIAWQPATNLTRAAGYFNLPPTAALRNINLPPDGKRFAATLEENARDIWILDGLRAPSFWSWWK
jgi:Tol biopolymer transport system component